MIEAVKDSVKTHWVNRAPLSIRPYLQLARLDRPVGYWLLALPGWMGLVFTGPDQLLYWQDLIWAALILIGAIAMRGAGCTYNDIVDQDLDAQVERTALRPLPAGTVTTKAAWRWTFAQIGVGFMVWLCLPWIAKGIALLALPLVAAYPFMKRITWFPQVWLGLTFNWAFLVAYAVKYNQPHLPAFIFYFGLVFWTVGYDTIYACQDIEDDAMVGIKSTARKFGGRVKLGVGICYTIFFSAVLLASFIFCRRYIDQGSEWFTVHILEFPLYFLPFAFHLFWQANTFDPADAKSSLTIFKSNSLTALLLIIGLLLLYFQIWDTQIPLF